MGQIKERLKSPSSPLEQGEGKDKDKDKDKDKYTNTNSHIQIQIQTPGRAPESNFDILPKNKSFHENGHISGTVRPTSPQHHSNRSSWRARPEKHLRGSLTCPGNTGEPKAPVSGGHRLIEINFGSGG